MYDEICFYLNDPKVTDHRPFVSFNREGSLHVMGALEPGVSEDPMATKRCRTMATKRCRTMCANSVAANTWLVDRVRYHYRYNAERVLSSTNYSYDVTSQRDGVDFFINHTAPHNLGTFELVSCKNCEVLEQNQLSSRTLELHFRLREGVAGSKTHFSYQLKPTDPHMSEDTPPLLATIGQLEVASVRYIVDFEAQPEKVWKFEQVPPPLSGVPELEVPTSDDDPRLLDKPYDSVTRTFRSLEVRYFYGIAWKW